MIAVHEAGHAVVAHALGVDVHGAHLTLGDDTRHGWVDLDPQWTDASSRLRLLAHLAISVAGAQAAALWVETACRVDPATLAACRDRPDQYGGREDCLTAAKACQAQPDYGLTLQAGAGPAAEILSARWPVVLRTAYWLSRREHLDATALVRLLDSPA